MENSSFKKNAASKKVLQNMQAIHASISCNSILRVQAYQNMQFKIMQANPNMQSKHASGIMQANPNVQSKHAR